jgi:subtilase family serine protease
MYRLMSAALLCAGIAVGGAAVAAPRLVEKTDGVYHVAVCRGPVAPRFARCFAHVVTDSAGNIIERNAGPNITPSGYGPTQLDAAYSITTMGASTTTIALVDAFGYDNAEADLGVYRAQFGLPACTTANGCFAKLNQAGVPKKYPAQVINWAQESALDLDMASAMCPNCKIILVEATTNSDKDLGKAVDTAAAKGAHVISNSYGGSEKGTQNSEPFYNHPGVAVTASTGDSGYGAQFPATSPHVIAVGGTTLQKSSKVARGWTEVVWPGAGSGCSLFYAKPAWQTDPSCKKRMEADVSAVANPATGVAVFGPNDSGVSVWEVFGGTSVAAPLVGGIYANNGGAVNYGSDPYSNTASLNDVVTGNNGTKCPFAYWCTAEIGYDGPTGLGTPIGTTAF